jgi:predicted RNA-binding Zn-ribbon protein involved in translation (DUF1610 family)
MAIIKCPECGHEISDKAPVCPSCGVEIAGNVIRCPQCGEVYFKNLSECPKCHHLTAAKETVEPGIPVPPKAPLEATEPVNPTPKPKKRGKGIWIAAFIIALVICGGVYYFYQDRQNANEQDAYEYAMQSQDPTVLQDYLDKYKDADEAHRDSIQAHLTILQQETQGWTNAVISGSKEALQAYLDKYPNTPHKAEIAHKIDSIDWVVAQNANTADALQQYLDEHLNGEHIDEANNAMKDLMTKTVQPEEKSAIATIFRQFFQSINSKNEDGLSSTVSTFLSSFLGKTDATKSDVITFMHKIYKSNVSNMNWHLNNDYKIDKKEVGEDEYEYTVQFSATQQVEYTDATKQSNKFRVNATVDSNGKISAFNMVRIIE